MYKKLIMAFAAFLILVSGCYDDKSYNDNRIVNNYADSIYEHSQRVTKLDKIEFEVIHLDLYPFNYYKNRKYNVWIYADSIDKYSSNDKLYQLTSSHKSLAVRYVAFKLLLKRDSHRAISYLIRDINNEDSICAKHLDEGWMQLLTSIRVNLAQNRKLYNVSVEDSVSLDKAVLGSKQKDNIWYYTMYLKKKLSKK